MRVAILESIVMPAGHEVEFDRILVEELKRQGHEPVFFVPEKYPFKLDYKCPVEYLEGGEAVSYANVGRLKRLWLSIIRERRRVAWLDSAYEKAKAGKCDAIIVPTNSWRVMRSIRRSKIQLSSVPVLFMFHGIMPNDRQKFIDGVKSVCKYKNIHLGALGLQTEFPELAEYSRFHVIMAPVYKPMDLDVKPEFNFHSPLRLGYYGQYRKEKNLEFFLQAFAQAKFVEPVKLIIQGATVTQEDGDDFERLAKKYSENVNIEFIHKNLLGMEWQQTLMDCDVMLLPYGAERYLYQPSAMLFTAIGYFKPVLQSSTMNPEILAEFKVGEVAKLDSVESFSKQLENFVNTFREHADEYRQGLIGANKKYSHENLIKTIVGIVETRGNVRQKYIGVAYRINEYRQQMKFYKDLITYYVKEKMILKTVSKEGFVHQNDIPKILHYAWFGPGKYNETIVKCMDTWRKVLPDYEIKFWNESNFPWQEYQFAREAMDQKKWGLVADVARLHVLYNEGGIYVDTDVEILKSFNDLLHQDGFACYETERSVSIGTFGIKKGHPCARILLDWYNHVHCDDDYKEIANVRIVSKLLSLFYCVGFDGMKKTIANGITIYPKEYFLPEKMEDRWCPTENSYVIHHYTGLW